MTTLFFILTVLTVFILFVRVLGKLIRYRPVWPTLRTIGIIVLIYALFWGTFSLIRKQPPIPMGTEICFDDWCATVSKAEQHPSADSLVVTLYILISNHARGIAQSPSEPRIHILDDDGHLWPYSVKGQQAYEKQNGLQPGIGHRLELHRSVETVLIFSVPRASTGLKALIEEGPWITHLLFPEDQPVFALH